jgi:hypothetical protein
VYHRSLHYSAEFMVLVQRERKTGPTCNRNSEHRAHELAHGYDDWILCVRYLHEIVQSLEPELFVLVWQFWRPRDGRVSLPIVKRRGIHLFVHELAATRSGWQCHYEKLYIIQVTKSRRKPVVAAIRFLSLATSGSGNRVSRSGKTPAPASDVNKTIFEEI